MPEGALLLDTHVWLWFANGDEWLAQDTRDAIEAAARAGMTHISAISVWEVALLEAKGRINLAGPCERWVDEALSLRGFNLVGLTPAIAIASTRLPGSFHGDPADRILVATAQAEHVTLVTRDQRILAYARDNHLQVRQA